jgi:hypothetical protein
MKDIYFTVTGEGKKPPSLLLLERTFILTSTSSAEGCISRYVLFCGNRDIIDVCLW